MKKYYYKIQNNVELLCIVSDSTDPFRPNEKVAEFFVNNIKFEPKTEGLGVGFSESFRKELDGFQEVYLNEIFNNKILVHEKIGLMRINSEGAYFVSRHLIFLNKISYIFFYNTINENAVKRYLYLVDLPLEVGNILYQKAYDYYQMSGIEELYEMDKLSLIEFRKTIELQSITINDSNGITIYFRPSWDEEHGLYIRLNTDTDEIEVE